MRRLLLGHAFVLALASAVFAQTQANTGQIEGTVLDPSGAVVAGATVTIRNTETNQVRTVVTDEHGFYRIAFLRIGPYEITADSPSFAAYQQSGLTLSTGEIVTLHPQLGLPGAQEQVAVVAGANIIETSRTNLSRAVNEIDVTELPNLSSSELNFAFLQPFVSGDPPREYEAPRLDFGGLSRRLNYQVDGFQNSSVQQKAFRVIIFSTVALQETQIASYGATADSGRTGGPGVVNSIIKSGTNEVRGTTRFSTYRKAFNALPYGSLPGNEPSGNTFAGAIGGPLKRDRLFAFASYEGSKRAFPQSLGFRSETSRTNAARLGFAGPEVDVLPSTFNPQMWLLKLDWKASATQSLAVRGNTFREFFAARDPGGTTVLSASNGATFNEAAGALAWMSILSPRMINEFRAQLADRLTRRKPVVEPGPDTLPTTTVSGVATFGYPTGLTANREQVIEVSDNVSWVTGAHQFKAGFNFIQSPLRFEDQLNASFTFGGLPATPERPAVTALDNYLNARAGLIDPATGRPFTYTQLSAAFGEPILTYAVSYSSLYTQDEWHMRPNLTLNYGVRWETVTPPDPDRTSPHELSRQLRQDRNNIAPRAGFAWAPRGSVKTAVRGSYGLHFDAPQANHYRNVLQQNGEAQFSATIAGSVAGAPVYPHVPTSPAGLATARSSITVMDPAFEWMYVHQAHLSVARALADDISVTFTYALTKAEKIPIVINVNLAPPVGTLDDGRNLYSTARVDPRFNNINMVTALGRSNYNAFGVNLNKRLDRRSHPVLGGLQFNVAYTWSHALDDAPESGIGGGSELPQDSFDRAADYGNALADVRHVFNASAVFRPRADNRWLDDNQISLILFARSGNTFDVRAGTDLNRDSVNNDRPPFVGRNTHKGPSSVQLDMRYARFVRFGGRYRLQLLAEAANLLNRANPDSTNTAVNRTWGTGAVPVTTFGEVIRFREMRRVQLGVRFDF